MYSSAKCCTKIIKILVTFWMTPMFRMHYNAKVNAYDGTGTFLAVKILDLDQIVTKWQW